ncbi:MAG: N-acetylneuraminate synthase family protein [Deferribacterales bacterium]
MIRLTKNKSVGNFCKPYIIAELGSNHNGDMKLAETMIMQAKEAGADCVKFQSWSKETIFSRKVYEENYFLKDDYRQREDFSLEAIVEEFSISEQELLNMKKLCDNAGLDCISTPFSKNEVDFLVNEMQAPFIKVASMDLTNYPFLEYIASKGKPVVLSIGMSNLSDVDRAVRTIEEAGNREIVILHCVSIYPPKDEDVNLNRMDTLRIAFPDYPVGFSDHTIGTSIPLAAVAKGACIIEKHYTLDKDMFGWDHKVSADYAELKEIVEGSARINTALGSSRVITVENEERREAFKRSIILKRDYAPGEIISAGDIDYKRPGTGIAPEFRAMVAGRTVRNMIKADYPFSFEDLI